MRRLTTLPTSLLLAGVLSCLAPCCLAQVPGPPRDPPVAALAQPDGPIHTLHVYMDLIQVPVLVLDSEHGRMKPIAPDKFRVSLDSGPDFRPRSVRREGDDPISLAILLDPATVPDPMPHMSAALSSLVPGSLQPHDHVSLLTLDCGLVRTLDDATASSEVLRSGVDRGLEHWVAHRKDKHPAPCDKQSGLWDSMVFAVDQVSSSPGRRVLLVVSNGVDTGGKTIWNELLRFAQHKGVAVFGYIPGESSHDRVMYRGNAAGGEVSSVEDPFRSICELSGGMIVRTNGAFLPQDLARFVTLVRERYILEFTRPREEEPGRHSIVVTLPKADPFAYIRPAGVSVVLPDAAQALDPDTIPRDTTDAPELGKRKILKPSQPKN